MSSIGDERLRKVEYTTTGPAPALMSSTHEICVGAQEGCFRTLSDVPPERPLPAAVFITMLPVISNNKKNLYLHHDATRTKSHESWLDNSANQVYSRAVQFTGIISCIVFLSIHSKK